jgi:signal transduction histidine kinase
VAVLGDRRQLVSAMHALLENAVTYSYDNSKVVVSGTVRHPTPGTTPAHSGDAASAPLEPVEAAFTQQTLGDEGALAPGTQTAWASSASSSTAPTPSGSEGSGMPAADGVNTAPMMEERDTVRLSVQDHGIGIPARDLERIFERFYRVDHGRSRDTGGTGLGLSIVRHVANNHQGWVDVESREGDGSSFSLVLPLQAERVV